MIVLGLDLGTKQGWACYDTESGALGIGRNNWEEFEVVDRIVYFGEWFEALLGGILTEAGGCVLKDGLAPVDVVGFEQVTFSAVGRSDYIAKQEGLVQYLGRGIAWTGVNVSTLKKFSTGDGHAKKPTMVAAARYGIRALGYRVDGKLDEDSADAFLVMAWVLKNSLKGWEL